MRIRRLALLGVVAAALTAAAPAHAINDPRVPGDECSNFHAVAVGDPLQPGNPGINGPSPITPPASLFGQAGEPPGVATGANGLNSQAIGTCLNTRP
jgi:hypothetical protein